MGWIIYASITAFFAILYPVVLAIIAHCRLHVSWKYFGFGALIFFLFQLISRVPLVTVLGIVFQKQIQASSVLLFGWLGFLAITAGLAEEVGRYVGYRWLMGKEEKTWNKAVMYGIGHGGLESMLLIGGQVLLTIVNLLVLTSLNVNTLPAAQHAQVMQQVAAINAQPAWTALLGGWERLWTLPVHIALSVVVLQVFRRGNLGWLWLAVLLHAIVDFTSVMVVQVLGASLTTNLFVEGIIALFGLIAIWIIWRLRDHPQHIEMHVEVPSSVV